jgi:NAD(P)-dependent dehydrogenase (short-subunit alcohol dehydrogenase family)
MHTDAAFYPSLAGKVAFVTGGASGIGAAIVEALVVQNCHTAFADVDRAAAELLCDRLHQRVGRAPLFLHCDVRDLDQLGSSIKLAGERLGPIDILVNKAAHDGRHAVDEVDPAYWDDRIAINLRHYFFAAKSVLPQMRVRGSGSIINFSSNSWKIKTANYPLYAMCKAAAHGLTRSLARDIGQHQVRINTVTPGWVMTERQLTHHIDAEGEADIERNQCLPGRVMPADLAEMVLFLASDASRMCTAQEFVVDAGWT